MTSAAVRPDPADPGPARSGAIVVVGFMGAGKTTVGRLLADRLGLPFSDSDQVIESRTGRSIREIFATDGEPAFRELEHQVVAELVVTPGRVVSVGGGAAQDPRTRELLARAHVVHLDVSLDQVRARVGHDPNRPVLTRPDLADLHRTRAAVFAGLAEVTVRTDGRAPSEVAAVAARLLAV